MAARNTVRAPKRSAVQPLAGMKIAKDSRYEVTASFKASGLVPISAAIAGSDVAMTVESMFSMNSATAMISGTIRSRGMENTVKACASLKRGLEAQSSGKRKAPLRLSVHNSHLRLP